MCSIISDAISKFENQGEKEKLANDALNLMMDLAKQQMHAFKLQVTNANVDTKHIPIGQILYEDWQVRCSIAHDVTALGNIIKDTYSAFARGDMAEGIASVLNGGLKVVMGTFVGNKSEREVYSITTGDMGGIQRVDLKIFAYRFTAEQLTAITKDCVAVAIIVSSVDPKKVTEASIRVLVQNQFGDVDKEKRDAILKNLLDARKSDLEKPNFLI